MFILSQSLVIYSVSAGDVAITSIVLAISFSVWAGGIVYVIRRGKND